MINTDPQCSIIIDNDMAKDVTISKTKLKEDVGIKDIYKWLG